MLQESEDMGDEVTLEIVQFVLLVVKILGEVHLSAAQNEVSNLKRITALSSKAQLIVLTSWYCIGNNEERSMVVLEVRKSCENVAALPGLGTRLLSICPPC